MAELVAPQSPWLAHSLRCVVVVVVFNKVNLLVAAKWLELVTATLERVAKSLHFASSASLRLAIAKLTRRASFVSRLNARPASLDSTPLHSPALYSAEFVFAHFRCAFNSYLGDVESGLKQSSRPPWVYLWLFRPDPS